MANNQIQQYADMVNLQMAAEAFWGSKLLNEEGVLAQGNTAYVGVVLQCHPKSDKRQLVATLIKLMG